MTAKKMPPREYLRDALDYDPQTGSLRWRVRPLAHFPNEATQRKCNTLRAGSVAGTLRANGYLQIKIYNGIYFAHRIVWLLAHGEPMPAEIDHVNGDRANNQISNLRAATTTQNRANRHGGCNPRSGVRGVRRMPWGTYEARIHSNGVEYHIGCFATLNDAATARRKAAEQLHGDFANHG
jgi:hypothetical protein